MTTTLPKVPCSQQALPELTETETSCLKLIAEGMELDDAALTLDLPRARVDLALISAQQKLGARNLLQAISTALLAGRIGKDEISVTE